MEALNASIGEQDVDAAEFLFGSVGSRSQRGQVALIELDAQPAAAVHPDQPPGFLQVLRGRWLNTGTRVYWRTDIETDDVRALTGEGDGRGAADAAGGARDHGQLFPQKPVSCRRCRGHTILLLVALQLFGINAARCSAA